MSRYQRHYAREIAVRTLYSLDFNSNLPPQGEFDLFQGMNEEEVASLDEDVKLFASFLINGTIQNLEQIDNLISSYSKNRTIDKIDIVDRNILRIGFYQLLMDKSTHPTIIIDESVKLSQSLSNDSSFKFINGILDAYAKADK